MDDDAPALDIQASSAAVPAIAACRAWSASCAATAEVKPCGLVDASCYTVAECAAEEVACVSAALSL